MKACIFIQTRNFEGDISEDAIEGLTLKKKANDDELENLAVNKNVWNLTGVSFKHALKSRPFFFAEFDIANMAELQEEFNLNISSVDDFFRLLWLVKDCSCYVDRAVISGEEIGFNIIGSTNRSYSNSAGSRTISSFSQEEIDLFFTDERIEVLNKIFPQIKSTKLEKDTFETHSYFSMKNTYEYNDLNRIQRAFSFIVSARSEHILPAKIAYYVLVLECLFSADDNVELSHKVSERVAFFLRNTYEEREKLFKDIKIYYDIRSKYVHGQKMPKTYASNEVLAAVTEKLDIIAREIFLKIIDGAYVHFLDDNDLNNYVKKLVFGFDFSQTPPSTAE